MANLIRRLSRSAPPLPTMTISSLSLHRELGSDAISKSYLATYKPLGKTFELKVFDKETCLRSVDLFSQLENETSILKELQHENILAMRLAFCDEDYGYIARDYFGPNRSLEQLVERRKIGLPIDACKFYLIEIGSALTYLHERRILHRNVKPSSIVLGEGGHAYLTDFSQSKRVPDQELLAAVEDTQSQFDTHSLAYQPAPYIPDWNDLGTAMFEVAYNQKLKTESEESLLRCVRAAEFRLEGRLLTEALTMLLIGVTDQMALEFAEGGVLDRLSEELEMKAKNVTSGKIQPFFTPKPYLAEEDIGDDELELETGSSTRRQRKISFECDLEKFEEVFADYRDQVVTLEEQAVEDQKQKGAGSSHRPSLAGHLSTSVVAEQSQGSATGSQDTFVDEKQPATAGSTQTLSTAD